MNKQVEQIRNYIEQQKASNLRCKDSISMGQACEDEFILRFIDSLPEEKPSKDLEVAAEKWCKENGRGFVLRDKSAYYIGETLPAFIAGAEWQAKQMPMPEDTVLFQKGVAEGKRLMMEDAVECELYRDGDFFASIDIDMATLGYTDNDKVKIIIVKEEDEQ